MRRVHPGTVGPVLLVLVALLPLTACDKAPKRRGPQNYHEYRAANDPRYRGAIGDDASAALSSDDGEFGPASGAVEVTSADAIRAGQVAGAGSVSGRVSYAGKEAKQKKLDLSKDVWCAGNHEVFSEDLVVSSDGGLKNVLVYVSRGLNRFDFSPPSTATELNQDGCRYVPHVVAMMAGQDLKIINNDGTSHNYHFTGRANDEINKTQAKQGQVDLVSDLTSAELSAVFRCDIHPWMVAPTHLLAHPYFVVTDEAGNFELKGLPPGSYEISFVHERSDMTCAPTTVTVEAGKAAQLTAQFTR